jgi:hypothetical protein
VPAAIGANPAAGDDGHGFQGFWPGGCAHLAGDGPLDAGLDGRAADFAADADGHGLPEAERDGGEGS